MWYYKTSARHIQKRSRKHRLYQKLPHECSQHATPNWGKRQTTPNSINQRKTDKMHIQHGILICHKNKKKFRYKRQHQYWRHCIMENKLNTEGCVVIILLWNTHKESDWLWAECDYGYRGVCGVCFGGGQNIVFFSSVKTFKQMQQIILCSVMVRTQQLNKSQWCISSNPWIWGSQHLAKSKKTCWWARIWTGIIPLESIKVVLTVRANTGQTH